MGFDITTVTYLVSRTVFEEGDRLLFVLPERDVPGRTRQTLSALDEFLQGVVARGGQIVYEFLRLSDRDLLDDLLRLLNYVNSVSPSSIYVWAVGGTRSIVSLLTVYSLVDPRVERFTTYSESNNLDITVNRLKFIDVDLSDKVGEILKLFKEFGGLSLSEFVSRSGLDYSKVYRLVSKATKMGLLNKGRGRRSKYRITKLGEIYLELLRIKSTW